MGRRNQKTAHLAIGVTAVAILLISAPAEYAELLAGQSGQDGAESSAPLVNPTGSDTTASSATPPEPDMAESRGAESFDTLCNNGQGKPEEGVEVKKRRGLFGLADRMAAATRKVPLIGDFMVNSANSLSQSVACRLYPEEQKQAAEAMQEATQSEEVGKTVEWKSMVRDNVSGSSTISAKNKLADGMPCLTVTDVIFVDAEELRVSKKMCRLPGASRYTVMNA